MDFIRGRLSFSLTHCHVPSYFRCRYTVSNGRLTWEYHTGHFLRMLSAGDILSLKGYRVLLHAPRLFRIRIFTIISGNFFPHFYIAYCNHCIFKCQVQEMKKVFFKKSFYVSSAPLKSRIVLSSSALRFFPSAPACSHEQAPKAAVCNDSARRRATGYTYKNTATA